MCLNSIKESCVREMSEVKVPVVIWGMKDKRIETCMVGIDTTFADVIEKMNLKGVENALMGHADVPFKLLPCDFVIKNDWEPGDRIPFECLADNFENKVIDIVFWMDVIAEGAEIPIADLKSNLAQREKIETMLPEALALHVIHIFLYCHRTEDCRYGEHGYWTERDPVNTTTKSSLWLQLEKQFLTGDRERFYGNDWTKVQLDLQDMHQVGGEEAAEDKDHDIVSNSGKRAYAGASTTKQNAKLSKLLAALKQLELSFI